MARYPLNLPTQLKQDAETLASQQGVSLNQFIQWAVSEKVGALKERLDDPAFPQITYRRGAAGVPTPVLRGTGIRVQTIVIASRQWQMTRQQIADEYDLTPAQIERALSFYDSHAAEIERSVEVEEALARNSQSESDG